MAINQDTLNAIISGLNTMPKKSEIDTPTNNIDLLATNTTDGLMSSSDKSKLDGIAVGANKYVHPETSGNKHIPSGGSDGQILKWESDGTAKWATETKYGLATETSGGLMSSTDKTNLDAAVSKLSGIAEGANNYSLPIASNSQLGGVKTTSTISDTTGLTACPIISGVPYYKDTYNEYSLPTASSTTLGGVKTTSTVTSTTGLTACPIIAGVPYYEAYSVATASVAGLMSASDKTTLDAVSSKYALKSKYGDTTIDVGRLSNSTVGSYSTAEGINTTASGTSSHAEGWHTTASGTSSHAEGYSSYSVMSVITDFSSSTSNSDIVSAWNDMPFTLAKNYSHSEGYNTLAIELYSHAEGVNTIAMGRSSHAEGWHTTASGGYSHAGGYRTTASGTASHAEGYLTTASGNYSHAGGHYNATMPTGGSSGNTAGTAFVIGNGTSDTVLSNAFSIQFDGTVKAKSTITASTTADYAEFFEWLDGNPNDEDRVGYFVTLDGNKIRIATNEDDYILGVVSGEPFVLGNGDCDTWNGMYLRDEFRRTIYEPAPKVVEDEIKEEQEEKYIDEETGEEKTRTVEVLVGHEYKEVPGEYNGTRPKLNPNYDHTQKYISRFERKEWAPVGMLGVLAVRHDGTAKVNGYVTVNENGIATTCDRTTENSYRVIKSNSESVVEIIFR